jgi:hypothetical protein
MSIVSFLTVRILRDLDWDDCCPQQHKAESKDLEIFGDTLFQHKHDVAHSCTLLASGSRTWNVLSRGLSYLEPI